MPKYKEVKNPISLRSDLGLKKWLLGVYNCLWEAVRYQVQEGVHQERASQRLVHQSAQRVSHSLSNYDIQCDIII